MIIQMLLVVMSLFVLLYFLRNESAMHIRAYKRIVFCFFVVVMVVFILSPNALNYIARLVGVGRGADLLLYCFFFLFLAFAINVYVKFKKEQDRVYRIARKLALIEAGQQKEEKNGWTKSSK